MNLNSNVYVQRSDGSLVIIKGKNLDRPWRFHKIGEKHGIPIYALKPKKPHLRIVK